MGKRHEAIGIKQAIRFEWMQKAANLLLAGLDAKPSARSCMSSSRTEKQRLRGERRIRPGPCGQQLMKIWSPDPELIPFRDASLRF